MNKTNQFKSSEFYMASGDILHMIFIDENGVEVNIELIGDEISVGAAPGAVIAIDASDITSDGFTANWLFTENANGYYFNLATDPDMTPHIGGYDNLDVGNVNKVVITGLTSGVTYYYQISAYNDIGEGLDSNVISTLITSVLPLVDLDGNNYTTIVIGYQEWTVENLKVTKYADGSAIPNITANGSSTTYNDWYLPSLNEFYQICNNLTSVEMGANAAAYWTSSETSATNAYQVWYPTPVGQDIGKYNYSRVRAIRKFTSTDIYSLRDVGPAGGWIFYIINNGGGNYTYYEASNTDTSVSSTWSNIINSLIGTTGTAIGTGQANTTAIISQAGQTDSAAKLCDDLSVGYGGTGWLGDTAGAYCWYDNDISNKTPYGALYNWYAVNHGNVVAGADLVYFERGGTEETGWKIPSTADFETLKTFLDGYLLAGGKLKEIGLTHWQTPNEGASNLTGFTGIGAGRRDPGGTFNSFLGVEQFHSSDDYQDFIGYGLILQYNVEYAGTWSSGISGNDQKKEGVSVRCVRDLSVGTVYVTFTDPLNTSVLWRKGVRSGQLRVDATNPDSILGFNGVEDVDWYNVKST
jgi:uncharacterized protein (TIGR02145 family)